MQELLQFSSTVILISISGVIAPGPLLTANIVCGLEEGAKAGLKLAVGHTVIELPIILLFGLGLGSLGSIEKIKPYVAIIGALGLFLFAALQIYGSLKGGGGKTVAKKKQSAFVAGMVLTLFNPFFLIWWATVGLKLISDAMLQWSIAGLFLLFAVHIWMDYVWLTFTGALAKGSAKMLTGRNFMLLNLLLSGLLIYYGVVFILEGIRSVGS